MSIGDDVSAITVRLERANLLNSEQHYTEETRSGRKESPAIEFAVQDEIVRILKELLETRGMYQNVRISDAIFENLPTSFIAEFKKRPFIPVSRNTGNEFPRMPGRLTAPQPLRENKPLGTPQDELDAHFYLPSLSIWCSKCGHNTTFLSITWRGGWSPNSPYSILGNETEQAFVLLYCCAVCRKTHLVFQVVRRGLKLQLTGRSQPFRPAIAKEWPKEIKEIVEDAYVAAAEGDVPAAYYHLRTAIEFYLKNTLSIPLTEKIEGNELCDKYNAQCDARLKQGIPTFGPIYSELSAGLHSRNVTPERFKKLSDDVLAHLRAKELFTQYSLP